MVWYRLDPRDDDPAFFYANFGAALERAWPQGPDLPTFVDDDRVAEDAFAERYFTAVVERCGSGTFVLDNAHVLAREPMQRALARLVAAIDDRIELWFVGEEPPHLAARHAAAVLLLERAHDFVSTQRVDTA